MPMFAEIADKMPNIGSVLVIWIAIGIVASIFTLWLSWGRLWLGAGAVFLSACLGVVSSWPDPILDPEIIRELGESYLWHRRASGFIPSFMAFIAWVAVASMKRHDKPPEAIAGRSSS